MDVNDHKFQGFASKERLIVAPCYCGKKKKITQKCCYMINYTLVFLDILENKIL